MRLFVAVELSDEMRTAATATADDVRRALDSCDGVRFVPGENMHLTVRFIGHVDAAVVPALRETLKPPLPIDPFEIVLGGAGVFPRGGAPRVIWIGLQAGLESLRAMHDEFNRRLAPLGCPPEERAYDAHLTLARVKDPSAQVGRQVRSVVAALRPPAIRGRVEHATLFESRTAPRGSAYSALFTIPLTANRAPPTANR